jgi:hypothetical protein
VPIAGGEPGALAASWMVRGSTPMMKRSVVMKRAISRLLSIVMMSGVVMAAVPAVASARGLAAFGGRARDPYDIGCFSEWYGAMTNKCGYATTFTIPLTVENTSAGWHSSTVTGFGATAASNVQCAAYGTSKDLTEFDGGEFHALSAFGSVREIQTSTWVPAGGTVLVVCQVNPNGQVIAVNW